MIVTDSTGAPVQVEHLDADWLLSLAEESETQSRIAERNKLRLVAQWCVLHPPTTDTGPATWSQAGVREVLDHDETLGADGTPGVAAFCAEPLATALEISTHAAMSLIADVLNLQHRLPRTWAKVEALQVPAWRARRLATATATLSKKAAGYVDAHLADRIGSVGVITIDRLVAEAAALFDAAEQKSAEENARAKWGVRIRHGNGLDGFTGTSWLEAAGNTLDLTRFHDLINTTAAQLARDGDTDPLEIRKAKAIALITDRALGLTGDPTAAKTHLYLHAQLSDLDAQETTVGTVEKLGPVTLAKIKDWVAHSRVTITPVLDLNRTGAVDQHDPPPAMREQVILRDPHCVFPWCGRDSRGCDLDHIVPYDDHGPPGQTHPDNLAPLCRRHHRAKTTGRWRYQLNDDHTYTWHSPHARTYLVDHTGSHTIG
jgi:5-methylcytosine-specific restriction endonuclease McrA